MAKSEKDKNKKPATGNKQAAYEPSEMGIKEMMIQKGCSRERAIELLKNPAN